MFVVSGHLFPHLKLDDVLHLVAGQVQLDAVINLQAQDGHDKFNE